MKKLTKRYMIIFILAVLAVFYFIICYFQMPKGDDLLAPFYMSHLHYVDESGWEPNERLITFGQAIRQFISYYMTFNGRIPVLFSGFIFGRFGQIVTAVISSLVYVSTILTVAKLGLQSWDKVVKAPIWLLFCSIYMYQLTPTGSYIEMWTFVCQYGIPTLLYLLYYQLVINAYRKEEISVWEKTRIFILGFCAGLCHECLGVFCICLVLVRAILEIRKHHMHFKRIWLNIGLWVGYVITFSAPGNFKRLLSNHDEARYSLGIIEKMSTSIYEHFIAAGVLSRKEGWMFLLLAFFATASCIKMKKSILFLIESNLEILVTLFLSVLVWAVFAPPVPQYGLQLWKALLIIFMLRFVDVSILSNKVWELISISGIVIWIGFNIGWVSDLVNVTIERRGEIADAVESGKDEVYVRRYPESTAGYLTLYNYTNNDVFDNAYAIEYYGIRIKIEE